MHWAAWLTLALAGAWTWKLVALSQEKNVVISSHQPPAGEGSWEHLLLGTASRPLTWLMSLVHAAFSCLDEATRMTVKGGESLGSTPILKSRWSTSWPDPLASRGEQKGRGVSMGSCLAYRGALRPRSLFSNVWLSPSFERPGWGAVQVAER